MYRRLWRISGLAYVLTNAIMVWSIILSKPVQAFTSCQFIFILLKDLKAIKPVQAFLAILFLSS